MKMVNKTDILEALGLQEQGANWMGTALIGFGVGALVGAAVALLVAPKAGYEMREDLIDRGRKFVDKTRGMTDRPST